MSYACRNCGNIDANKILVKDLQGKIMDTMFCDEKLYICLYCLDIWMEGWA